MSDLLVEGVSYSFGDFEIKDVNLEVKKGEIASIIGPNGAGKSTLLKLIYGLIRPEKGRVLVEGRDVLGLSPGERAKILGFVPQNHVPTFPFKVLDFVLLGATPELGPFGAPGEKHRRKAWELLRTFGLENYAERPYTSLSGGQMRLLLTARALMTSPKYLLLDEPTSELDLKNSVLVLQTVKKLARGGVGVLLVIHDPNLAYLFSDRLVLMKDGKIVTQGKPDEVFDGELLSEVYGIELRLVDCSGETVLRPKLEV
ncbi:ABC transporter ATP-binding protein [Thermococcus waiotapuensis]|uniref:ABC transporter ATP-binding protein n=1 Tax=Thermococcus waiotapuensis TaxID=90909 RepID=A0AAE4T154_9EURY|nr:ABC transporter ATP-binding protein [Thermococcus waiotapuensis]MDV3103895.1 ABC transporter ATP-binding protein [Thermococcus waiotapuensis]